MRALIVDDEPLARRGVALRLRQFSHIEAVDECGDGRSALKAILELAPQIVFLDVQMPAMDGFAVLRALPKERVPPAVIFLTAHEQHALQAFEVHALDYLLKPIDDERFVAAVERASKLAASASTSRFLTRFVVRTGTRMLIVPVEETQWIAAAGDYAELHVNGRSHLLRETMHALERELDPTAFIRIHRSRIVRAACIVELRSIDNREYLVKLSDGSQHRSSRTYADRLQDWLAAH